MGNLYAIDYRPLWGMRPSCLDWYINISDIYSHTSLTSGPYFYDIVLSYHTLATHEYWYRIELSYTCYSRRLITNWAIIHLLLTNADIVLSYHSLAAQEGWYQIDQSFTCYWRMLCKHEHSKGWISFQVDLFEVEAVHLENVKKLIVGHNEREAGQGWFLHKIVVRAISETTPKKFTFFCDRWASYTKLNMYSLWQVSKSYGATGMYSLWQVNKSYGVTGMYFIWQVSKWYGVTGMYSLWQVSKS